MAFYLYRFLDEQGNILYIGRTNDIKRRILKEHFTENTHLPNQCYLETEKVEYVKVENESEEVAYEAILINENSPRYNIQFKDGGNFDVQLPEFEWIAFEWEYKEQLEWLKNKKKDVVNASEVVTNYMLRLPQQNIMTGILDVDSNMIMPQHSFTLIAGVSGMGKTTYLLNIANFNVKNGKKVLFINLKDGVEEISMRFLSIESMVPIKELLLGQMDDKEWENCIASIEDISRKEFLLYNTHPNHWDLDKIISTIRIENVDLVIIDDLQVIEHERNKYIKDSMDYILKNIKVVAVQSEIPVIGTYCIPSTKISDRENHRPMLEDLEFDSLRKYPDNIQLLYVDAFYDKQSLFPGLVDIITVKSMLNSLNTTQVAYVNGLYGNIAKDDIGT